MNGQNNPNWQQPYRGVQQPQTPYQPPPQTEPEKPRNGWKIFMALIIVGLIIVGGFLFMLNKTYEKRITELQAVNQTNSNVTLAFNQGVVASIIQLMKSTDSCQVASIKYLNVSRQIVDIDCVRKLLQQQNITLK